MPYQERVHVTDYLKAICIIMVIITHYSWETKSYPTFTYGIRMAVPIFMILSGYNAVLAYEKRKTTTLKSIYAPSQMLPKILWIMLPYTLLFFFEAFAEGCFTPELNAGDYIYTYLTGGFNEGLSGGYYVACLLELTLTMPIIYVIIKKSPIWGLLGMLAVNIIYEMCVASFAMDWYTYRIIYVRYIFMVTCGMYMALGNKIHWGILAPMFTAGIIILYTLDYGDLMQNLLFCRYWANTNLLSSLYIVPLIYVVFALFRTKQIPTFIGSGLELIGRSTWHIFLYQMIYYRMGWHTDFLYLGLPVCIIFNIVICCLAGCAWSRLEKHFQVYIKIPQNRRQITGAN